MPIDDPAWPRADRWLARGDPDPDLVVVGVPTSAASLSPSAASETPVAVRAALGRFSTFDGERGIDLDGLRVADQGDWDLGGLDMEQSQRRIEQLTAALPGGAGFAFIGGDNAITRPLVRGLSGGNLDGVGLLTLDAHHDVRTLDRGPTNGTPVRGLLEDGLPDGRVAQVGILGFANSPAYRAYCDQHGFTVVTMSDVDTWGVEEAVGVAIDALVRESDWVFLDVDLDVLDAAFAPGCPGARPGGMTPRQLGTAVWLSGLHPKVRAADFVEVDATADPGGSTVLNLSRALLAYAAGVTRRTGRG